MISVEEFIERLCRLGADRGRRRFPRKRRDRDILMKSIVMRMDSSQTYSESEINEILLAWKRDVAPCIDSDHVAIRRHLVDYGKLERSPDGSYYRVGFPLGEPLFDLEIDDIDPAATIAAYRDQQRRRRKLPPEQR